MQPKHNSNKWMKKRIKLFEWPSQRPDLDPTDAEVRS